MTFRRSTLLILTVVCVGIAAPFPAGAQQIFHSTQSANLPTAEMLNGGNWLFEISHRFLPTISDGAGELWGFDGPVRLRFGLTYAASDRLLLGVLRTNYEDNLELNAKTALFEGGSAGLHYKVAAMGGVAWNTGIVETPGFPGLHDNETQAYGQLIVNALVGERVAIGVVPTYLRNPLLLDEESDHAFVVGLHGQVYLTRAMSVLGEWVFSEDRFGMENDSGTFGIELQTRGHFFKIVVTNQSSMNPTQFLGGAPNPFGLDELRLGFNLTRLLPF